MKVQEVIQAANFQIIEGSPFLWKCFGKNARYLDFGQTPEENNSVSCIFDTKNQTVYEIAIYLEHKTFRWIHPKYIKAFQDETLAKKLSILEEETIEIISYHDALDKVQQVITKGLCDDEIAIPLKLSSKEFLKLSKASAKKNMSIHDFIIKEMKMKS